MTERGEVSSPNGAALLDVSRMREIFQAHLRAGDGSPIDVRACSLDYVRQSSGRLVAQYTLDVAEPGESALWRRTVTGLSYGGGRTRKLWSRLLAGNPAALTPIGTPPLQPLTYIPDLDILIQVFPYDRRLPGLRDVLQGTPEVHDALDKEIGPGDGTRGAWQTEVVRYRPEMRAVVCLTLSDSDQVAATHAYAKIYRDDDLGERAYQVLRALWAHTEQEAASFIVARPIAYLPGPRTLLVAELPGRSLLDIVRDTAVTAAACAMRRTARAVAELHQLPLDESLLPVEERDEQARLADIAAALVDMDPQQASALDELSAAIAARLGNAAWAPAPTHHDFRLVHVLIDGDQIGLLDFDKLAWGDPLVDIAHLAASLLSKGRADLAEAFLKEYFSHVPNSWRERYPTHHALALLSEAATTGRGQRGRPEHADRGSRVASTVALARDALADRLW